MKFQDCARAQGPLSWRPFEGELTKGSKLTRVPDGAPFGAPFYWALGGGRIRRWTAVAVVAGLSLVVVVVGSASANQVIRGRAVYYSNVYSGQTMACGRTYRPWKMVAAHRSLPCGTRLRVTNKANGRKVTVTVRDRGPYGDRARVLDVSRRAAKRLGFIRKGITRIRAVVLSN
jgi:rare lipoprotein A (peptidoglycan hydrolase)